MQKLLKLHFTCFLTCSFHDTQFQSNREVRAAEQSIYSSRNKINGYKHNQHINAPSAPLFRLVMIDGSYFNTYLPGKEKQNLREKTLKRFPDLCVYCFDCQANVNLLKNETYNFSFHHDLSTSMEGKAELRVNEK